MWWQTVLGIAIGLTVFWAALIVILWRARPDQALLREALSLVPDLLRLLRRLAADRDVPRGVRVRIWLLLALLLSPIDLVPDFVPVLGYADDAIVTVIALRSIMRKAGPEVVARHWPGSARGLRAVYRLARFRSEC